MPSVSIVLGLMAGPALEGQPPTGGPEFQVNVYTTYRQDRPDVAIAADGAFVVVWASEKEDGSLDGVFGRRYDGAGSAQGGEFQVNTATVGSQDQAAVAVETDGDFVVVWRSGANATSGEIYGRRFSAVGVAEGSEFLVNSYTVDLQHLPQVAVDGDGDFMVAWTSEKQDDASDPTQGRNGGVFGQRFDSAGARLGGEFQINTYTVKGQREPAIAMRDDGFFVVTWASREQDEDPTSPSTHEGVFAQRFSSTGGPLGIEFQVNTYTVDYQHHQSIGMDAEGDFVIAWHSNQLEALTFSDVFAQRFASSGAPVGGELHVNSYTPNFQEDTAIVMEEDGDFFVVWDSDEGDGDGYGVLGKRFDSTGAAQSGDFQINTYTPEYQDRPAVTRSVDGVFVVVWQSSGAQDSYGYGVFAKRFGPTPAGPVLDVDGDGAVGPLTDGLLVLRWAFSFTGTTLVNGAVGSGCTRCTGDQVEAYLDPLTTQLDIDGNGSTAPLTDGLLVLRYLFSFTGSTLVDGAVGTNCARCTAEQIQAHLATLVA